MTDKIIFEGSCSVLSSDEEDFDDSDDEGDTNEEEDEDEDVDGDDDAEDLDDHEEGDDENDEMNSSYSQNLQTSSQLLDAHHENTQSQRTKISPKQLAFFKSNIPDWNTVNNNRNNNKGLVHRNYLWWR